jgi:tetratricopeptide (TPR) repeat protein
VSIHRRLIATCVVAGALAGGLLSPAPARAFSNVAIGDRIANPTLPAIDGPPAALQSEKARVNLFIFFRPEQDHSLDALRDLAALQKEFAQKPVRMVGVVSDGWPAEQVRALVKEAGFSGPILIDAEDALYGELGVRLHPVVGLTDKGLKLVAYEHFRQINFGEIVRGRIRVMLGEASAADMARVLEPEKATTGTPEAEARRRYNLARKLWQRQNAEKALESLEKSLAVRVTAPALALKGEILAAAGKCAEARPLFEQALKIDPADPVALKGRTTCRK